MTAVAVGVESAREEVSRYAWREAFGLFAAADAVEPLGPDDLDRMAECAWWIGKMRHCIALRERAHAAYLKVGDVRRAAGVAVELAVHHGDLGEISDATAWIQKATRMLQGEAEGAEHGWLKLAMGLLSRGEGDLRGAMGLAADAAEIGARHGDKDLFALGHAVHGIGLAFTEDPERGLPMVEEATQGAVAGELGPRATGRIYCMMIAVNAQLADWQRAGQWTEAATRWCNRQAINGFPGVCRVHRAEIMRLRGAFAEAEVEARTATTELASFNLMFTAMAFRELGEIRVKMGDLDGAEEALQQASEMGVPPQPGLALVLVQRGRPEARHAPSAVPSPTPACSRSTGPSCCLPSSMSRCSSRTSTRPAPPPPSSTPSRKRTPHPRSGRPPTPVPPQWPSSTARSGRPSWPQTTPGRSSTRSTSPTNQPGCLSCWGRSTRRRGTPTAPAPS